MEAIAVERPRIWDRIDYFGDEGTHDLGQYYHDLGLFKTGRIFDDRVCRFAQFLEQKVQHAHFGISHPLSVEILMIVTTLHYDSDPEKFLDEGHLSEESIRDAEECMRKEATAIVQSKIEQSMQLARKTGTHAFAVFKPLKTQELARKAQEYRRKQQRRETQIIFETA